MIIGQTTVGSRRGSREDSNKQSLLKHLYFKWEWHMQLLGGSKHIKTFVGQHLKWRSLSRASFVSQGILTSMDMQVLFCVCASTVYFVKLMSAIDMLHGPPHKIKISTTTILRIYIYIYWCLYEWWLFFVLLTLSGQQELPSFHIKGHVFSPTDIHSSVCRPSLPKTRSSSSE